MTPRLKIIAFTTALAATLLTASGVAIAAPYHANGREHARLATACSTLSGQWSSATAIGHRHLRQARAQERIGQRDCNTNRTAEMKVGVKHYRSALRLIGVRPSA